MNTIIKILQAIIPLFLMLALGMICRKKQIFSENGVDALKSFALNITLPFVLFSAFCEIDYSFKNLLVPVIIFIVCVAALVLGFLFCKILRLKSKLTPYICTGFEVGMVGYAMFALLFPDESISKLAIVDFGQTLFVFTIYKTLLSQNGERKTISKSVKEMLCTPIIWAMAAGILFGATGLFNLISHNPAGELVMGIAEYVSAPTGAIILFTIGYDLIFKKIKWKNTSLFVILRLLIMAILYCAVAAINKYLLGGIINSGALMLVFILPPPFVLPIFAGTSNEKADIVSSVSMLTLCSIALFSVLAIAFA